MQSDPSDNGGLFVGRRPGTAPVRFRKLPERGGSRRQLLDACIAGTMLGGIVFLSLLCWGPIPVASLWVGSQVDYLSGSVSLGILAAVASVGVMLFGAVSLMRRLDGAWILVRRAANHDQRNGVVGRVFAITAVVCGGAFMIWFGLIHGPGSARMFNGMTGGQ
jgi:hypothetical protein